MARDDGDDEVGCLKNDVMLHSSYRTFQKFEHRLGRDQPDWLELDDDVKNSWESAWLRVFVMLEEAGEKPRGVDELAEAAFTDFYTGLGEEQHAIWGDLSEPVKLEWKHLVRHAANLLAYDVDYPEGMTVEGHEDKIDDYLRVRLEEIGFSLSARTNEDLDHGRASETQEPADVQSQERRLYQTDDDRRDLEVNQG